MFKNFMVLIASSISLGAIMVVVMVFGINNSSWLSFHDNFVAQKTAMTSYYFESVLTALRNNVESYSVWDEAVEKLEMEDGRWLEESVSRYLVENEGLKIDAVYMTSEDQTFEQMYGGFKSTNMKNLEGVQKALLEDEAWEGIVRIDEVYGFMSTAPFEDTNTNKIGAYAALILLDEAILGDLYYLLGDGQVVSVELKQSPSAKVIDKKDRYRLIPVVVPIFDSPYYVHSLFEMKNIEKIYKVERNLIITIVIISASTVCLVLLALLSSGKNKVKYITKKIREIKEGNRGTRIENERYHFHGEVNELVTAINALAKDLETYTTLVDNNYIEMTEVIVTAVEINDSYTSRHNREVGIYAEIIAREVGYENIDSISMAAKLHDIGKISIPGHVLNKPGKLTYEEYELIKTHPSEGYKIIENIDYFSNIRLGVRHHHERWDGQGYPDGLKGDEIPLIAQIISIADVYDACTSNRAYRKGMSHKKTVEIITEGSGKMFNPLLVKAFHNQLEAFEATLIRRKKV